MEVPSHKRALTDSESRRPPKKRRRLMKKTEADAARLAETIDVLAGSDDDSLGDFIVYSDEEESEGALSEDALDIITSRLVEALGGKAPEEFERPAAKQETEGEGAASSRKTRPSETSRRRRTPKTSRTKPDTRSTAKRIQDWMAMMHRRDLARARGLVVRTSPSSLCIKSIGLRTPLFFHQLVGLSWCMLREEIPFKLMRGGLLADDMGTGKTLLMLTLVAMDKVCGYSFDRNAPRAAFLSPTLIVCPATIVDTWRQETEAHFGHEYMRPLVLSSATRSNWQQEIKCSEIRDADVVIISYTTLRKTFTALQDDLRQKIRMRPELFRHRVRQGVDDAEYTRAIQDLTETLDVGFLDLWSDSDQWTAQHFLFGYAWRRVIFDECTRFKNDKTKNFQSVRCLNAERRWSLSGTPMENGMDELYAQFEVLDVAAQSGATSSKTRWNRFLRTDEFRAVVKTTNGGATARAIRCLKKRFLNVLQLRRERQTISLSDPISPYLRRASSSVSDEWTEFVREVGDRRMARLYRDMPGAATGGGGGDDDDLKSPDASRTPLGFYWRTPQSQFERGVASVDLWFQKAFNIPLNTLGAALSTARETLRAADASDHNELEIAAAAKTIQCTWPNGRAVSVFQSSPPVKPILLLGYMSELERTVYKHLSVRAKERIDSADNNLRKHNLSFVTVTSCRCCAADYRFTTGAPEFLDSMCGTELWSENDPYMMLDIDRLETFAQEDNELDRELVAFMGLGETAATPVREPTPTCMTLDEIVASHDREPEPEPEPDTVATQSFRVPLEPPTKFKMLLRYINVCPEEDKILVFSDMVRFFPQLRSFLEDHGIACELFWGRMTASARNKARQRFESVGPNSARILLVSTRCGSQGLNLQAANRLVMYMDWWNGAVESQAFARIDRIGQKKDLQVVYLALVGTVDMLVLTRAGAKSDLIDTVIGQDDGVIKTGSNFSRPDENRGILVDTRTPAPEDETLESLLAGPIIEFSRSKAEMASLRKIHNKHGRIDNYHLASLVIQDALNMDYLPPPLHTTAATRARKNDDESVVVC